MRYKDKADWIVTFIKSKKVLDLGCVEHDLASTKKPNWLYGIINKHAKNVLGVDYLEEDILARKGQGYNVVCANVETMELGDQFEVVVAGDLIEHLSNPGEFMKRVYEHLAPGGLFLLTTPNPTSFVRIVESLFLAG